MQSLWSMLIKYSAKLITIDDALCAFDFILIYILPMSLRNIFQFEYIYFDTGHKRSIKLLCLHIHHINIITFEHIFYEKNIVCDYTQKSILFIINFMKINIGYSVDKFA